MKSTKKCLILSAGVALAIALFVSTPTVAMFEGNLSVEELSKLPQEDLNGRISRQLSSLLSPLDKQSPYFMVIRERQKEEFDKKIKRQSDQEIKENIRKEFADFAAVPAMVIGSLAGLLDNLNDTKSTTVGLLELTLAMMLKQNDSLKAQINSLQEQINSLKGSAQPMLQPAQVQPQVQMPQPAQMQQQQEQIRQQTQQRQQMRQQQMQQRTTRK